MSGFKPAATIFVSEKPKIAKDILNKKSLLLAHLLLRFCYNFYNEKSNKLALELQSSSILPATFYGISSSKLTAKIFANKKVKIARDILNGKSLLLA